MTDEKKPVGEEITAAANGAAGNGEGAPDAEAAAVTEASASAASISALESELAAAKDQALRALAEAENTRRRAQREIEDNSKYALANFARDLLSVADNLRRALDAIPLDARRADKALDTFATGVELTEREIVAAFERYGVKRIDAAGRPFDHNFHQAVMQVETPDQAPGTVVQVFQPGYVIHGRLLRAAMVSVAKAIAPSPAPAETVEAPAGDGLA
jgi:molecular chaperone GrpE